MVDESYRKPLPSITDLNRPYWDYCKAHELRMQRCDVCSHGWYPPSPLCPNCLEEQFSWVALSGKGKVWSFLRMWQRYFPGFEEEMPYVVGYIQLQEGPRMMASIVGCAYEHISCDMDVEVVFDDVTPEFTLPRFRPIGAGEQEGGIHSR